jgi:hypothetical protein
MTDETEPMTVQERVTAKLWLDAIAAAAGEASKRISAELAADARRDYEAGNGLLTQRFPDLANVSASATHEASVVVNEAAFTKWVALRYPTAVYTETKVSPAWQTAFLKRAIRNGGKVFDAATDEQVPGVEVKPGGEFIGVSVNQKSKVATEMFAALAENGLRQLAAVAGSRPLALPGVE